ncbi:MAG TPA: methyltransferase domain-containing protein [Thermoanaerobaculia bacterium]
MGELSGRGRREPDVVREYTRLAPSYDVRWARFNAESTRETLARLTLAPDERLLDVGCGTGELLAALARTHPPALLEGVDPVPAMLAVARRKLPATVELRQAWAERLPHPAGAFAVVVSCNAFHYMEEPERALAEVARVLARPGRLVLTDWCADFLACRLCDVALRWLHRANRKVYRGSEVAHFLSAAGFRDVTVERYKIGWPWGLLTARARLTGGEAAPMLPDEVR